MAFEDLQRDYVERELAALDRDVDPAIAMDAIDGEAARFPIDATGGPEAERVLPDSARASKATAGVGIPESPIGQDIAEASGRRGPFEPGPDDRVVETDAEDFRRARRRHDRRSMRSQANDEARRAEVTTDYEEWRSRPDELDFPGVDSPPDIVPRF
jgi:hypothetical protein